MHLRLSDYALWFSTPILLGGVLVVMWRRGFHKDYPYFFNYIVLQALSDPVLALISARFSYTAYYYAYYVHLGLSFLISFAVLQEIFQDAFRPYEALRDLSAILFRWSALVILLVGVMWAINATQKSEADWVMNMILVADRSLRMMQCGLVFFLLLFGTYLGIPHRSLLFGISVGFGLFAAVNMLVATFASHQGISAAALSRANSIAYLFTVLIWLGYSLAAAPSRSRVAAENALRSQDWNSALTEVRVVPADSILDDMDRTVERLLYPPEDAKVKVTGGSGFSG